MTVRVLLLAAAFLAWMFSRGEVCRHGRSGGVRSILLGRVERAQERMKEKLKLAVRATPGNRVMESFDSGLPACRRRQVRRVKTRVPPELVGKTVAFGPEGRMPRGDVRVATSTQSLRRGGFDALADPEVVRRLEIRCQPSIVVVRSQHELEIRERP